MGKLHDMVKRIDGVIHRKNLPIFITKGKIGIRAGFILATIEPTTPDDPARIQALASAAREVLEEEV